MSKQRLNAAAHAFAVRECGKENKAEIKVVETIFKAGAEWMKDYIEAKQTDDTADSAAASQTN